MIPASLDPVVRVQPQPLPRAQADGADNGSAALEEVARRQPGRLMLGQSLPPVVAEQYRQLAARLHSQWQRARANVVMIASAMPGEGKTLTATNLALTLSESYRRRVIVIDADLRRPSMHLMFGLPNAHGVHDALHGLGPCPAYEITPRLAVIPAGRPNLDPVGALTSPELAALLKGAAETYDWVIVDTPPSALLADANLMLSLVDSVVMVVAANKVDYKNLQRAADTLGRERIIGVVLNRAAVSPSAYGGYGYDYGYGATK